MMKNKCAWTKSIKRQLTFIFCPIFNTSMSVYGCVCMESSVPHKCDLLTVWTDTELLQWKVFLQSGFLCFFLENTNTNVISCIANKISHSGKDSIYKSAFWKPNISTFYARKNQLWVQFSDSSESLNFWFIWNSKKYTKSEIFSLNVKQWLNLTLQVTASIYF